MFIKSLKISNLADIVRDIHFHSGLNLIVDDTLVDLKEMTGNNVGKTTILKLVDFCLGSDAKNIYIYTDPENPKEEYILVKKFLIDTEVLVTLTLTSDLENLFAKQLVIERNFLPRKKNIRKINNISKTIDEFEETLTNHLFPNHYGKKPTFSQIISHNIRYKEISITNTLKTLSPFTRDDEYETLYLFLLGCDFDNGDIKQNLHEKIRLEKSFKNKLESKQTLSAYETLLALLSNKIDELKIKKDNFFINPDYEKDLNDLNDLKYDISQTSSTISKLKLRKSLIEDSLKDIQSGYANIDTEQLKNLYGEATERLSGVQRSFEELLEFHNRMIDEKLKYIAKELPDLKEMEAEKQKNLLLLLNQEKQLVSKLNKSGTFQELDRISAELNEAYRQKGECETCINQIVESEKEINKLEESLKTIDSEIFNPGFKDLIQVQLNKLNKYFSSVSNELYGEQYALKVDPYTNRANQKIYKFSAFNTNFSSGKKQGEIVCFDIAYTLFADDEGISCYHFLLNDKKELMHDNQLSKIAKLVEKEKKHVQYIASILKDKLPPDLNNKKYFIIELSQDEKLFKIENN